MSSYVATAQQNIKLQFHNHKSVLRLIKHDAAFGSSRDRDYA